MNIKELLIVIILALVTTWGFEYLFFKRNANQACEAKSGQGFVAPKSQELKPIDTEIDFIDNRRPAPVVMTEVETSYAHMVFSTDAGSLERLEFKRNPSHHPQSLTTIFPVSDVERDKRCFLVALPERTPYYYSLVDHSDIGDSIVLTYQAETDDVIIRKKFTVAKDVYKILLTLTITPKSEAAKAFEPRIFYPAPIIPDIATEDLKSGVLNNESGSIISLARSKINVDMFWVAPTFFGVENRYFVHALVHDADHFVKRGFYSLLGQQELFAVIEGPATTQETTWNMLYYFGPKEDAAMAPVDPRLLQTLGYAGWFAPIAKWLLALLNYLFAFLGNYGLAIIALTILTRIVLLPFSIKGAQGMKKHSELQRKMKYLQQKYKDDTETLTREKAELMRKEGLTSMAGCLPLLLQLPIFFALSKVLATSIQLYQAPFYGWITDLSARDPYYILPLLVVAVMLIQALTVESSQRIQVVVMALIFGAVTANMSAGLCLYIFMSTLLGIIQTVVQQKLKVA